MKRLLICTIIRNSRSSLDRWYNLLNQLIAQTRGVYEISWSVAENDSTDGSTEWLREKHREWARWNETVIGGSEPVQFWLSTDKLGTQQYGSVWNLDRLKNLATARQQCVNQVGDAIKAFDKIAYIEVDCTYDPKWCAELILARHPRAAGLGEPDIYSGWSLRSESNPKESIFLYDVTATRATCYDTSWDITEANGTWRAKTVIPTDLGGVDSMCLHSVWSTFNGFCVYNAKPFIAGLKWSYINPRLDTGQARISEKLDSPFIGWLECDTAQICEDFRAQGYDRVFLNTNCLIRHA